MAIATIRDRVIQYEANSQFLFVTPLPRDDVDTPISDAEWDAFRRAATMVAAKKEYTQGRVTPQARHLYWAGVFGPPVLAQPTATSGAPAPRFQTLGQQSFAQAQECVQGLNTDTSNAAKELTVGQQTIEQMLAALAPMKFDPETAFAFARHRSIAIQQDELAAANRSVTTSIVVLVPCALLGFPLLFIGVGIIFLVVAGFMVSSLSKARGRQEAAHAAITKLQSEMQIVALAPPPNQFDPGPAEESVFS